MYLDTDPADRGAQKLMYVTTTLECVRVSVREREGGEGVWSVGAGERCV